MDENEILAGVEVKEWPYVYVLGSFDSRITLFSQQVRGFNLAHALAKPGCLPAAPKIAIIGAGAAGLAVATGLTLLLPKATISLFEREQTTLHLQRGCRSRNLHPHIYDWPDERAFASEAGLPYLNWSTSSAADVASQVGKQFDVLQAHVKDRLNFYPLSAVTSVRPHAGDYLLQYLGAGKTTETPHTAHVVILAIGFGRERGFKSTATFPYWSDQGTPDAPRSESSITRYLVSGSGDGALIDLCAAALHDFDHTTLINKVVGASAMRTVEDELLAINRDASRHGDGFDFMEAYTARLDPLPECTTLVNAMRDMVRQRGTVTFHTKRPQCLEQPTSTLNRFLVYLLFRAAKLAGRPIKHVFGTLSPDLVRQGVFDVNGTQIEADRVFIRHGTEKQEAFAPFAAICAQYETDHLAWLEAKKDRSIPPSLYPNAEAALVDALRTQKVPLPQALRHDTPLLHEHGWQGFAAWSRPNEGVAEIYLRDTTPRVRFGAVGSNESVSIESAIDRLRAELAQPQSVIRLVGLSGVGKTRLVQALFDERIGITPLSESDVSYADMSNEPIPSPVQMVTRLADKRCRHILVVDNCGRELHRSLTQQCKAPNSRLSLLTIEHDVRDDEPEETVIVRLDPASQNIVSDLLQRRFNTLPSRDADRFAHLSGGNARVALSLAKASIGKGDSTHLTDEVLFERLFYQGDERDEKLIRAAQACSLLYSFDGEPGDSEEGELERLAMLVEQSPMELYRHVSELQRRELVQKRGKMRAVLPHAIANRMATRALQDIPLKFIERQLVLEGTPRVVTSFTRRLSYLAHCPQAVALADRWLAPGGRFGDVASMSNWEADLLKNLALVASASVLAALDRIAASPEESVASKLDQHILLIARLAYDAEYFERGIALLTYVALNAQSDSHARAAERAIASLCDLLMPCTEAPAEKRLDYVASLVSSKDHGHQNLAKLALKAALAITTVRTEFYSDFGAQPRGIGPTPRTLEDCLHWYRRTLALLSQFMAQSETAFVCGRDLLSRYFRTLCANFEELVPELSQSILAASREEFWYEGYKACNELLESVHLSPPYFGIVKELAAQLTPHDLASKVRIVLMGGDSGIISAPSAAREEQRAHAAFELGIALASDVASVSDVLPELIRGGRRIREIGAGLAGKEKHRHYNWDNLVSAWAAVPEDERDPTLLLGYLKQLKAINKELAQHLLDKSLEHPALLVVFPTLQCAVGFDQDSIARMRAAFATGTVPFAQYGVLRNAFDQSLALGSELVPLLQHPSATQDGFVVVLEVVTHWLTFYRFEIDSPAWSALQAICRIILLRLPVTQHGQHDDVLARVAKFCLVGDDRMPLVGRLAERWRLAVLEGMIHTWDNQLYKEVLLSKEPDVVLDVWYTGSDNERRAGTQILADHLQKDTAPADVVSAESIVSWCGQGGSERFDFAASVVSPFIDDSTGQRRFSDAALALLYAAPHRGELLLILTERMPTHNISSVAEYFESASRALDMLPPELIAKMSSGVAQARQRLSVRVVERRAIEALHAEARSGFEPS